MSEWIPFKEVGDKILELSSESSSWTWAYNSQCKYVDVRVDMRDGHCILVDRHGNPIKLDDLERQH